MSCSPAVSFLGRCRFPADSSEVPGLITQATGIRAVQLEPSVVGIVESGMPGDAAGRMLRQRVACSTTVPIFSKGDPDQTTAKETASIRRMPIEALLQLSQCSVCVIAPMESADFDLIDNVLERLPSQTKVVLQLSADQLRERRSSQRLMQHLEAVVIESKDLHLFSHGRTQHDSMRHVNVLLSSQTRSTAIIEGMILELSVSESVRVDRCSSVDCLAAGYAAGLAMQQSRIGSYELGHGWIHSKPALCSRGESSTTVLQDAAV